MTRSSQSTISIKMIFTTSVPKDVKGFSSGSPENTLSSPTYACHSTLGERPRRAKMFIRKHIIEK